LKLRIFEVLDDGPIDDEGMDFTSATPLTSI
jgi:hypothetical protein